MAELTPFTNQADLLLRENTYKLVESNQNELRRIGVSDDILNQFLKKESCRIEGIKCQIPCDKVLSEKNACVTRCAEKYSHCAKTN
jgi:hypothetical protein